MGKKFYELSQEERLTELVHQGKLTHEMKNELKNMSLSKEIANHLIENQISEFSIPLGVALNFSINQKNT